jgi:hypothetical protein
MDKGNINIYMIRHDEWSINNTLNKGGLVGSKRLHKKIPNPNQDNSNET